jgi:hypothetical protein
VGADGAVGVAAVSAGTSAAVEVGMAVSPGMVDGAPQALATTRASSVTRLAPAASRNFK